MLLGQIFSGIFSAAVANLSYVYTGEFVSN